MKKSLRVLIVEDSEDDTLLIVRELTKGGYEPLFKRVDSPDAMIAAIEEVNPETIIADYTMPYFSGTAALDIYKNRQLDIPFILVSGTIGDDVGVQAMISGAHDYICKNNLSRLVPAINRELKEAQMRIERKSAEQSLRMAHDELEKRVEERTIELAMANKALIKEIQERKNAEQKIINESEKLKILSDNAPFGMILADEKGQFLYTNKKFTELFGYDRLDIPDNKSWIKNIFPTTKYRHNAKSIWTDELKKINPGEQKSKDFTVICKNGTQKIINFTFSILSSGGYLIACEDITNLKRVESQLRHAQKVEAIGTLAGGIAHDFNNILTVLAGYATLLKMRISEADSKKYVDQILLASQKAADLTSSLLTFSRQRDAKFDPINIDNHIEKTQKIIERLLSEDISIKISLKAANAVIMADETQIDQILLNLATNARDAMPKGGRLSISTSIIEIDNEFKLCHGYGETGKYVLLSISDTGTGIDEEIQERIFDPFFTTKEIGKGTGLGLATVYGIVKQHNGYINAYSEQGMGATFNVYLPITNIIMKEPKTNPAINKGGNETILIAEDNHAVRNFIMDILVEHGYSVIEAIDGSDAIEKFTNADNVDLLIFDSIMPNKNGYDAYSHIRNIKPDVKIIFTSGYTKDIFLDKGVEDKEFAFLQKPVYSHTLLQKIRDILDNV